MPLHGYEDSIRAYTKKGRTSNSEADPSMTMQVVRRFTDCSLEPKFASGKEPIEPQDVAIVKTVDVLDIGTKWLVAKA
jgi:hypothetical protein